MMTSTSVTPITTSDLAWWQAKIATLDWVFAVRYAAGAPHEYVSERSQGISKADFVRAARVIHTFGEPQKFFKTTRIYLVHDGWKYWTMDDRHTDVTLINRGRAEHVYGTQNAPQTATEAPSPYDGVATFWDAALSAAPEERQGYEAIVDEVTGGNRKCRALDLGAGTGLTLDLGLTEACRLTAVDPSQAMLNELVRKHPLVARVEPLPFTEVRSRKRLAGTQFDLVLALGGSASYLTDDDWLELPIHAKGNYALSVLAENEQPPTSDLTAHDLDLARSHAHDFAKRHHGRIKRVGRFEVVVVSQLIGSA